jgi:hypothetical protein
MTLDSSFSEGMIGRFKEVKGVAIVGGEKRSWSFSLPTETKGHPIVRIFLKEHSWFKHIYDLIMESDDSQLELRTRIIMDNDNIFRLGKNKIIVKRKIDNYYFLLQYSEIDENIAEINKVGFYNSRKPIISDIKNRESLNERKAKCENVGLPSIINWRDTIQTLLERKTYINGQPTGERLTSEIAYRRPVIPVNFTQHSL